jgi:DNA-binding response OmpR family regulator
MSVIEGKRVVFVGNLAPSISSLKASLEAERAAVSCAPCSDVRENTTIFDQADLIVLNQHEDDNACSAILSQLQSSNRTKHMPVFSYVDNVESKINRALMLGAADYFTPTEDVNSVLQKVKSNFGVPNNFAGVSTLDITEAVVTSTDAKTKVYVVEDDPLLRALLSTKFDMSGVGYDFSADGLGVEEKIRVFKPSVILLDIMIGAVNGLDILESIKATTDLRDIPVIVFSNQDSDEERRRAAQHGANDYLVKATTDLSDLVKMLTTLSR